ncbi:hypothetical protein F0562_025407 [Nyssa sinensis]|uniref:Uncharacterized protein n=1 Tax=Nyssa sinensis TaxID=561372 RepID=A0A5J5BFC9_9ASTE|nr:hypothetical protein F0562_025407 [Nyssa sinensis]
MMAPNQDVPLKGTIMVDRVADVFFEILRRRYEAAESALCCDAGVDGEGEGSEIEKDIEGVLEVGFHSPVMVRLGE